MALQLTPAHSSRITKSRAKKATPFNRSGLTPFSYVSRRKPIPTTRPTRKEEDDDDLFEDRLDDLGTVDTLATDLSLGDVVQTIHHIHANMFDEVPIQKSGMSGARIADVLTFRKALPALITNAHIHAMINSPTKVEREIAQLVAAGLLRKVIVPGRGVGAASISECIILVKDWVGMVQDSKDLAPDIKEKYISFLESKTPQFSAVQSEYGDEEITSLMRAGFLTSASTILNNPSSIYANHRNASSGTLISLDSISRAASGSIGAIGGQGSVLQAGGGGSGGLSSRNVQSPSMRRTGELKASLPTTGSFLKLIEGARSHLIYLLSKSKYSEGPVYLLRERWDGGISTKNPYGRSKDPFSQTLPGKTRKWKEFYGLRFDWVLAECLGGGLLEVFETGSVGLGARVI